MLSHYGAPAYSSLTTQKLLSNIQTAIPGVLGLQTHFIHFVELDSALNAEEQALLDRLLQYGPKAHPEQNISESLSYLVVPRPGTISPWSSN